MKSFILTRQWRDTAKGIEIDLWLSSDDGPIKLTIPQQKAIFFIRQIDIEKVAQCLHIAVPSSTKKPPRSVVSLPITIQAVPLKNFHGEAVAGVYCSQYRQLRELCAELDRQHINYWENDIRPPERFLMERFVTGSLVLPDGVVSKHQNHTYSVAHTDKVKATDYHPSLSVVSLDIETSMDARELYSICLLYTSPSPRDRG